jgi:hypothetical protein
MLTVRQKPASRYHPPCRSGGMRSPYCGAGGSSASHGRRRTNSTGSQFTAAHMLRPMISNAMKPKNSDSEPSVPR